MNEMVKTEEPDFIEGEFMSEQISGFGCGYCSEPLVVGTTSCPNCLHEFAVPTPLLERLNASRHSRKMEGMALIYKDRMTVSELEARQRQKSNFFVKI